MARGVTELPPVALLSLNVSVQGSVPREVSVPYWWLLRLQCLNTNMFSNCSGNYNVSIIPILTRFNDAGLKKKKNNKN